MVGRRELAFGSLKGRGGNTEWKGKLCTVPIGRVCSSVGYRSWCQHTHCAQYSYCHKAKHTFLSPFHSDTCTFPPCLTIFYLPKLTGYILRSLPLSVLPHGLVHQCHVPGAKLTDLPSFAFAPLGSPVPPCIYYRLDTLPDIGLI